MFCKVMKWRFLRHANVLPLIGVLEDELAMVSPWMVNGSINEFVRVNKGVDRFKLVGSPCVILVYLF